MSDYPLIQDCVLVINGDTIAFEVTGNAIIVNCLTDAATTIEVNAASTAYVLGDEGNTYSGAGTVEPLASDRGVWDVATYAVRHASDIDDLSYVYHNDPNDPPPSSLLGPGSFFVGDISGHAVGTGLSGDITVDSAGVVTIGAKAVDASNLALTNGSIFIGGADGAAHEQSVSNDASISNAGALTLTTVNADVGTYGDDTHLAQITVDAKGRITAVGEIEFSVPIVPLGVYNEVAIADGSSTTYYLTNYAVPSTIRVYINGIRQPASDDTVATDEVIFDIAPVLGAVLIFDYEMEQV